MLKSGYEQLENELSILGRKAHLSLMARQKVRDQLFQKIGQQQLVDAMQTQTEVRGLIMPVSKLRSIFQPRRIVLSLPATIGLLATVFAATFTTSAFAKDAQPGEPLFAVRKAFEAVQLALVTDPNQKAEVQLAIVSDRLEDLKTSNPKHFDAVVNESKRAIASVQSTLSGLDSTSSSSQSLAERLRAIIDTQVTTGGEDSVDVQKTILAVRKELEAVLSPEGNKKVEETTPSVALPNAKTTETVSKPGTVGPKPVTLLQSGPVTLNGVMGSFTGRPVLIVGNFRYFLEGSQVNLIQFMGSGGVQVIGVYDQKSATIRVTALYIDSKLIWQQSPVGDTPSGDVGQPDKSNNSLTEVDNVQN